MPVLALILAAEEGVEKKEGIELLLPPLAEVFWGTICFAILFFLLWKFAFPALKKMMDERSATIQDDLTRAEQAKVEAEEVLAEYRAQLGKAREESARIIEDGRKTADEMRKDLLARAEADAKEIVEAGRRDVENAVGAATADLRRQMADLSIDLAGRIIGRQLDPAAQAETVDSFIRELETMEPSS